LLQPDQNTNIVALLLLLARLGDIGSTYLITPKLRLEANPLVRRWKWPFAFSTLLIALVPYYWLPGGVVLLVGSLLVCFSNFSGLWLARAVGEDKYLEFVTLHASRTRLASALLPLLAAGICVAAVGLLLLYLYPNPNRDWGFFVAVGILGYAIAITLWRSVAFVRLRKIGKANYRLERP
jgi:hypothetical protein